MFIKKALASSKNTCTFAPSKKSNHKNENTMYWTLELASKLEDAPWPATRDELLDWALRTGAQEEIIENL